MGEALALARIPQEYRTKEADLFGLKWFDYRGWHPVIATYYWAHCYAQAQRSYCEVTLDRTEAQTVRAFPSEDIFLTRDVLACWIARQALDTIGARYDWAMTFITRRYVDRGWRVFPRPNQLYGEELVLDIRDAWAEECRNSLQIAQNPLYRLEEQQSLTALQREYVQWLFAQVRARGSEVQRPLSRLLKERSLTPSLIGAEFGADALRSARLLAGL